MHLTNRICGQRVCFKFNSNQASQSPALLIPTVNLLSVSSFLSIRSSAVVPYEFAML